MTVKKITLRNASAAPMFKINPGSEIIVPAYDAQTPMALHYRRLLANGTFVVVKQQSPSKPKPDPAPKSKATKEEPDA